LAMRIRSSVRCRSVASAALTARGEDAGLELAVGEAAAVAVGLGVAGGEGAVDCVGVVVTAGLAVAVGLAVVVGLGDGSSVAEVVGAGVVGAVVHAVIKASSATRTSERSRFTGSATVHRQA
jgi:hypothetical protein